MSTDLTTGVFEIIVCPGEVKEWRTEEEVRRVSASDAQNRPHGLLPEGLEVLSSLADLLEKENELAWSFFNGNSLRVVEHLRSLMKPARDDGKRFPLGRLCLSSFPQ